MINEFNKALVCYMHVLNQISYGLHNRMGLIRELQNKYNLSTASKVVISGQSAGGMQYDILLVIACYISSIFICLTHVYLFISTTPSHTHAYECVSRVQ